MKASRFVYPILKLWLLFFFLSPTKTFADSKVYSLEDLPRSIQSAVRVSTQLENSMLQSDLEKQTHGSLLIGLQLETLQDYYIYEDSIQIEALDDPFLKGASWKLELVEKPQTQKFLDPVSKKLKSAYRGQAFFKVKATLSNPIAEPLATEHTIPFKVRFQACSTSQCLLPAWLKLEQRSSVNEVAKESNNSVSWASKINIYFKELLQNNSSSRFEMILLLLLAGLITAFTPCVYPLYPITIGIFGRWEKKLHFPAIFLALAYCLGMTLSYASLGVFTLLTGSLFASITQTPLFLLSIGFLILLSSIFFSGLINFPIPAFLQNYMSHVGEGAEKKGTFSSLAGALAMGASLGIVASPCVGPVLVALLAWLSNAIAAGQATSYEGFILLSAFGAGMSLPFLVLGHLILKMKMKIQIGRFTPLIKYLGTALLAISSLIFLIPGYHLLTSKHDEKAMEFKFPTFSLDSMPENSWNVLDFRADWCTACIQLEKETFSNPSVSKEFESGNWNYVQVDFTSIGEKEQQIADKYEVISLPTVLIMSPQGSICVESSLHEFERSDDFLARLKAAKSQCK